MSNRGTLNHQERLSGRSTAVPENNKDLEAGEGILISSCKGRIIM